MAEQDATLELSSGALCFGSRTEVSQGAKAGIQPPSCPEWQGPGDGTVMFHSYEYNLKALDGTWRVYKLVAQGSDCALPRAALVCHESIQDVYGEAKRIVDAANAPWERDNPATRNTRETWEGRVMVVNRYDWTEGYYQEEEDGISLGEENMVGGGQRNSRWLVDYQKARESEDCTEWVASGRGTRLVIFGEYLYGRFGLTEDRSCVQSFLMFTHDTEFAKTSFRGDTRAIYVPLTEEQRHAKCLANGSYSGFDWLRSPACQIPEDLVGPFDVHDMISLQHMEDILKIVQPKVPIFEPQLQQEMLVLINESLAVWVYCLGRLAAESASKREFMDESFPNRDRESSIHFFQLQFMERNQNLQVSQEALYKIVASSSKLWTFLTKDEVSCGMRFLLREILELAGNSARDCHRQVLVPYDIRIAINNDQEMCNECLNCNKLFWPPDMTGTTVG